MRNYPAFPRATPHRWAGSPRVPHPSATFVPRRGHVRLACIRHAASVNPEPGSNSPPKLSPVHPKERPDFVSHCLRASSTMRLLSPNLQRTQARPGRVGPPSSAAHSALPAPHELHRVSQVARQPTCQGAAHQPQADAQPSHEGRLIYHVPLPVSRKDQVRQVLALGENRSETLIRGPLNLPRSRGERQGRGRAHETPNPFPPEAKNGCPMDARR